MSASKDRYFEIQAGNYNQDGELLVYVIDYCAADHFPTKEEAREFVIRHVNQYFDAVYKVTELSLQKMQKKFRDMSKVEELPLANPFETEYNISWDSSHTDEESETTTHYFRANKKFMVKYMPGLHPTADGCRISIELDTHGMPLLPPAIAPTVEDATTLGWVDLDVDAIVVEAFLSVIPQ